MGFPSPGLRIIISPSASSNGKLILDPELNRACWTKRSPRFDLTSLSESPRNWRTRLRRDLAHVLADARLGGSNASTLSSYHQQICWLLSWEILWTKHVSRALCSIQFYLQYHHHIHVLSLKNSFPRCIFYHGRVKKLRCVRGLSSQGLRPLKRLFPHETCFQLDVGAKLCTDSMMLIEAHPTIFCQLFRCPFNLCFVFLNLLLCSRRWRFRSLCSCRVGRIRCSCDWIFLGISFVAALPMYTLCHVETYWWFIIRSLDFKYICSKTISWRLSLLKFAQGSKQLRLGHGIQYPRRTWAYHSRQDQ